MFIIEMLPAYEGDCLWIEYGSKDEPRRILIDGGTIGTAETLRKRIERIQPPKRRQLELLVVTHVDSDHIAGILKLLQDPPEGFCAKEAWFNAYPQLAPGMLGPKEGEFLTVHFDAEERRRPGYWNGRFGGKAVGAPKSGPLPTFPLEGDMQVTVLAPGPEVLAKLRRDWKKAVEDYFTPGDVNAAARALKKDKRYRPGYLGGIDIPALAKSEFEEDTKSANGSSIVVLLEHDGRRCLFAADTFPSTLLASMRRLPDYKGGRLPLTLMKIPHHASMNNNSNELYRAIDCRHYLISTNGGRHHHPHLEAIARILDNTREPPHLYFNYRSADNEIWLDHRMSSELNYTFHCPKEGEEGCEVEL